jgi:CubicO group peptidase (beta-lactamase class C family)
MKPLLSILIATFAAASAAAVAAERPAWPVPDWKIASPESEGFSAAKLAKLDEHVRNDLPNFRSIVITRRGRVVYERYYAECTAASQNVMASTTKSVVSALVGIAIKDRVIKGPEQPIAELLPAAFRGVTDAQKRSIRLQDVLTMRSGLAIEFRETVAQLEASPNWVQFILSRPMTSAPGDRFEYGGGSHLLTAILAARTGMSAREFAERRLFQPLGIRTGEWSADPQGIHHGTHGLHMTTRDMARFGYLYLHGGRWNGKQIVPAAWVKESVKAHSPGGPPESSGYGYQWWVSDETGYPSYFAAGYGGQFIYVVPGLELVVAMTGNAFLFPDKLMDHRHVIREYVTPAITTKREPVATVW